ncbi:MAG: apolipoprotein N-acyltransferase [Acidobacteriia bacterium]|nr:apolipoprotein N-acyltransferase [Terriglobia bacterium]
MAPRRGLFRFPPPTNEKTIVCLRLIAGAACGALLSLSCTGWYLGIFAWMALALLLLTLRGARGGVAFASGFLYSFVFVVASIPWIATVLVAHGGMSRVAGIGVLLLIAAVFGTLTGGFAWCVQRIARRSWTLACAAAPFLWVAMEFGQARMPDIGFPWNLLGYAAAENLALAQLTTLTGIYGLSFVVAAFNALLAWTIAGGGRKHAGYLLGASAMIVVVMWIGPGLVPEQRPAHYARAVQLNFPELEQYPQDWFGANAAALAEIESLSLAPSPHSPDLLIWPEAPAPFSFQDAQFARRASSLAIRFGHPFLAGAIEWKATGGEARGGFAPYNSAILVDAQGQRVFSYDKMHLVPFGEYEPFPLIHQVVRAVSEEVGGFRAGRRVAVGRLPGGERFGVFICYEAIFPGEIRRFAANGAQLFVNISNDGWFGRSAAPKQHLRMARIRAVENRRWLLRVTNNGYTVSVDPYGRVIAGPPADVRQAADLPYDFRTGMTVYARFGDWFAWLCVLISAILLAKVFRAGKAGSA